MTEVVAQLGLIRIRISQGRRAGGPARGWAPVTETGRRRGAETTLGRLPDPVATAIVAFMVGPVIAQPERAGKPLLGAPSRSWTVVRGLMPSARRLFGTLSSTC